MSPFSSITTTTVCPILPGLMGIWQKRQIGGTPKSKSTRPRSTSTWDRHPVPFRAVRGRHDPSIADERAPAEDEHRVGGGLGRQPHLRCFGSDRLLGKLIQES